MKTPVPVEDTRVLVVGLGSIGRRHARLLAEREDVQVLLFDPSSQALDEATAAMSRAPAATFNNYGEALATGVDLALICAHTLLHVELARQALRAGADLFVEKPLADNLEAAQGLVDEAQRAGRILQVGYQLRFDPGLRLLKRLIDDGELGSLVSGRAMIGTYLTLTRARTPAQRLEQPNALVQDYTHELDFLRWLFGPMARVTAASAQLGDLPLMARPNVFQMIFTSTAGALVQVHMDYVQMPQRRTLEIYGDRAAVEYDWTSGQIRLCRRDDDLPGQRLDEGLRLGASNVDLRYRDQLDGLFAACRQRTRPVVDGQDGIEALRLAMSAVASVQSQRVVEIDGAV